MKTSNKKNTASQALLDLEELKSTLKEESKNTIATLLNEAIKDSLNDMIQDDEDKEDDDEEEYTISDDAKSDADVDEKDDDEEAENEAPEENTEDKPEEGDDEDTDSEDEDTEESDDNEWSEFDKYKNEDGAYDFSGENDEASDEALIKVYKLLKDSDQVIVKKDGNRAEIKDGETGSEYIIDFGDDTSDGKVEVEKVDDGNDNEDDADDSVELNEHDDYFDVKDSKEDGDEMSNEDYDNITGADPFESEGPDGTMDDEVEGEDEDKPEFRHKFNENKNQKTRKTMKENKVLFEVDLGYTDNYQDKDPIDGLSNNEVSPNGAETLDKGIPTDTKKPWAGKGKNDPFTAKVNEEEEIPELDATSADTDPTVESDVKALDEGGIGHQGKVKARSTAKTQMKDKGAKVTRHDSKGGKYHEKVDESVSKKLNQLMKENKALKEAAIELKKNLQEVVVVNVSLGQVVKLLQENTTTRAEKVDIINRFDSVKTIAESKALYESISRELTTSGKKAVTLEEKSMTAAGSQKLNEAKVYENPALNEIRNMMSRMDKAY